MGAQTSRSFDPRTDIPDLTGRVAIVTGANTGIGFHTVLHLARRGAKVYLGARNESKATGALARLESEGMGPSAGEVIWLDLDLSDPRAARRAAKWFLDRESRLDILVNNAGKIIGPYGLTSDGISDSIVINHLSPAAFTYALIPLMKTTASQPDSDVRIVNLSSVAHRWIKDPRYDTLERLNADFSWTWFPKIALYAYTKLAIILWTSELQRRLDREDIPIIVTSVHPGRVLSERNTERAYSRPLGKYWIWFLTLFNDTPYVGAYLSVFAAASPKVRAQSEVYKGRYVVKGGRVEKPSVDAQREDLAGELWETTEQVLAKLE